MLNKSCELMDSNSAPLALKAATIQTFPQQLLPERNEGLVVWESGYRIEPTQSLLLIMVSLNQDA